MKEILFILGNGFNHFMNNYLKNPQYQADIQKKLEDAYAGNDELVSSWIDRAKAVLDRYCHLLDDISLPDTLDSGEFLLSKLANFCETIDATSILDDIERAVSAKTQRDMVELTDKNSIPKTIRTLSKLIGYDVNSGGKLQTLSSVLYRHLDNLGVENIHFVTTNYDQIVDEVFDRKTSKFHVKDDVMAIHGTYNNDEVICSCPDKKEEKVDATLMEEFEIDIEHADVVILFGLGLFSDPHILKRLNMIKNKKFIIIDACQDQYFKDRMYRSNECFIGFDFLYQNEIMFIDTACFQFSDKGCVKKPVDTPEELIAEIIKCLY